MYAHLMWLRWRAEVINEMPAGDARDEALKAAIENEAKFTGQIAYTQLTNTYALFAYRIGRFDKYKDQNGQPIWRRDPLMNAPNAGLRKVADTGPNTAPSHAAMNALWTTDVHALGL
jgi:hypothetical protein